MSLFARQLLAELQKMFARRRTYIGFGAFLAVELLILVLLQLPQVQRSYRQMLEGNGYAFEHFYSGPTLGFMILISTFFLLGSLYLSLVAGDVVAKEVEDGTLRMMLCRPISRLRILLLKYAACLIYTFALLEFIGLTALGAGMLRQGAGGLFVFAPLDNLYALFEFGPGLARYLGALPLLALSLTSVTSVAFMLSCFPMKPAAATISTLSYITLDFIFHGIPYFESIRAWLLTTHMSTWTNLFRDPIPVWKMVEDYGYLLGVDATLVTIGAIAFIQRDLKS